MNRPHSLRHIFFLLNYSTILLPYLHWDCKDFLLVHIIDFTKFYEMALVTFEQRGILHILAVCYIFFLFLFLLTYSDLRLIFYIL